jgi:hypothetical protein
MQKKYVFLSALVLLSFALSRCKDDDVAAPPKPNFVANKTSAEVGEEITFTVSKVTAEAISLHPYGLPGTDAGVLISNFSNPTAEVKFSYARPGTFQAIVVANNASGDGSSIKNVKSDPVSITISSSKKEISEFEFKSVSAKGTIDQTAKTIAVTVPYGTSLTNLKAKYTVSAFSKVSVSGVVQQNDTTLNDFSSPKVYTVTANNGSSTTYTVTVSVTPIETINTVKSISPKATSKGSGNKTLEVAIDNSARTIVVLDTLGTQLSQYDSVTLGYELNGKFAILKYNNKVMPQNQRLDLRTPKEIVVYSQDSTNAGGIQTYDVYAVSAPKLTLSFPNLNPDPAAAAKPVNFNINVTALRGTSLSSIVTNSTITTPPGVTVSSIKANNTAFTSGTAVNYTDSVKFEVSVNDSNLGISYTITYTVKVTLAP